MLPYIVTILGAYLIGCSNMALYLSKLQGVDLRAGGSKNLGASNAFALMGWKAGLIGALAPAHPRNLLPAFDPGRLRFLPERVLIEADLTASLSVVC